VKKNNPDAYLPMKGLLKKEREAGLTATGKLIKPLGVDNGQGLCTFMSRIMKLPVEEKKTTIKLLRFQRNYSSKNSQRANGLSCLMKGAIETGAQTFSKGHKSTP